MIDRALGPDDQLSVTELSPDTLDLMASRVEASSSLEQIVYRETELDEVWRLADIAVGEARRRGGGAGGSLETWSAVRDLVHLAHDLLGRDEDTVAAASALRKAGGLLSDASA